MPFPLQPYRQPPVPRPPPQVIDAEFEPAGPYPPPPPNPYPAAPGYLPPPYTPDPQPAAGFPPGAYPPPPVYYPPHPAAYPAEPPPTAWRSGQQHQRLRVVIIVAAAVVVGLYLVRQGGTEGPAHYPSTLADVQEAGGFWKLSAEQQAIVRKRWVYELQLLLEQVNVRMRYAQYYGVLPACYGYRNLILQLQGSINRARDPHYDPTAEQVVMVYVSDALAR